MDCERYILRDDKHNSQRARDGDGDGRVNVDVREIRRSKKARERREGGYPTGFYHRALHCSLTISSSFSGRGDGRAGTNGRRKSCGTCRCSRRPCHRTWKTPITRQSLKRRPPLSLAKTERRRKRGSCREPTRDRGTGEDVLRDST